MRCGWDLDESLECLSDCQCQSSNCPGFDPSILRHSGKYWTQKIQKIPLSLLSTYLNILSLNMIFFNISIFSWRIAISRVACFFSFWKDDVTACWVYTYFITHKLCSKDFQGLFLNVFLAKVYVSIKSFSSLYICRMPGFFHRTLKHKFYSCMVLLLKLSHIGQDMYE